MLLYIFLYSTPKMHDVLQSVQEPTNNPITKCKVAITNEFQNWMQWLSLVMDEDRDVGKVDIEYERDVFTASMEAIFEHASDSLSPSEATGQGSATKAKRFSTPGAVGTEVLNVSFYIKRVWNILYNIYAFKFLKSYFHL
jgi:hypothetical protein